MEVNDKGITKGDQSWGRNILLNTVPAGLVSAVAYFLSENVTTAYSTSALILMFLVTALVNFISVKVLGETSVGKVLGVGCSAVALYAVSLLPFAFLVTTVIILVVLAVVYWVFDDE